MFITQNIYDIIPAKGHETFVEGLGGGIKVSTTTMRRRESV